MAHAKLTLIGIYNYDQTLFDLMQLPTGINKDEVINAILLRGGEFPVLYADGDFCKAAIGSVSLRWQHTFERWVKALSIDYEPLNNYDRTEEWNEIGSFNKNDQSSREGTATNSGTSTDKNNSHIDNSISAYDSDTMRPSTGTDSTSDSVTSATSVNKTDEKESGSESGTNLNKRSGRAYGNIGIVSSQQMLESELDIAAWNLYEHIADIFLTEITIPIYV